MTLKNGPKGAVQGTCRSNENGDDARHHRRPGQSAGALPHVQKVTFLVVEARRNAGAGGFRSTLTPGSELGSSDPQSPPCGVRLAPQPGALPCLPGRTRSV